MPTPRRLRILLSAYYCSPYRGGESAVGWRVANELAKHHDVTVLCGDLSPAAPTAADHARYLAEHGPVENLRIIHLQAQGAAKAIHAAHKLPGLWFLFYEAYRRWQLQALSTARELHREAPFDLVHHVTVIGFREPGYLWRLGIPFFWGPINGAALIPWAYLPGFGLKGLYRHTTRNLLNALQLRLPGRSRSAAHRAAKLWTVTPEDEYMVRHYWNCTADTVVETGASPKESAVVRHRKNHEPLRIAWCGIIEDRKALHLLLRAICELQSGSDIELHVIGDGPDMTRCRNLSRSLGIDRSIVWHGRVPHATVEELMGRCHVLAHPALKEGTPHVVLEAMSNSMPVICHNACGMAVVVTEESGIKIPMTGPSASILGFRDAISRLIDEPDLLERLSRGAHARAHSLSWSAKAAIYMDAYGKVLDSSK